MQTCLSSRNGELRPAHRYRLQNCSRLTKHGFLWSPKRNADNGRNPFYEFMREVSPGDLVFSFFDIVAFLSTSDGLGIRFPPCRTSFSDFLRAAHTLALAQAEAHRAVKAASPKATVGSAYEMAPAYPKTDSDDDRAAAARYHAMNNVFFLEAAMHGRYPKAFVGEPSYELMGFKAGDEKLLYAPLDWVGFHYYTRRIVSDASKARFLGGGNFSGTEIESNSPGGRDPYTRFRAAMPTEVRLPTPVWRCGRAVCMTWSPRFQGNTTTRSLKLPRADAVISIAQMKKKTVAYQMCAESSGTAKCSRN
jgi:Glycosyl hydrolase family 1